ncbi:helix-turn-helix transcriptional regulator [Mechercharimyces sp. CAU 1602]|uniref:ArsR/SmtB family transcription factor n=1 Tax=Mechercharimyces sp. CAU 1602 TaxID=2973933 RepID=UPI0021634A9A|nr:helix-turn-helix transcriptional regulator [Mechercharimyces sp. CAU 1602]MCS1351443.1 ArsR family transcriptional regulator [Mechercharimyces sp. CAU 1602]
MNVYPDIAYIAKLIAEPTRAIILDCLLDGRSLPASQLAYHARVSHPTMSSHLSKLVEGKLLRVEKRGRHRYYSLAGIEIAEVLEKLGTIAPPVEIRSLHQSDKMKKICYARTCYDHLAGELGVKIFDSLLGLKRIERREEEYVLTPAGTKWCLQLGIQWEEGHKSRRIFLKPCLDWSERREHMAGWFGWAIAEHCFSQKWLVKCENTRAVVVTERGKIELQRFFHIETN